MSNDEKWQLFGKTLGDVAEAVYIYLGVLVAAVILLVVLFARYRKKRREQPENNPKQTTGQRIVLIILTGLFVLLISPVILGFILH